MNKNKLQMELIIISSYVDIISFIMDVHHSLSINKLLVFSYLMKKNKFIEKELFSSTTKNNIFLKYISQMTGLFDDYCEDIEYIISALHLLIEEKVIHFESPMTLYSMNPIKTDIKKSFQYFAIEESKKISEKQFCKEVIKSV